MYQDIINHDGNAYSGSKFLENTIYSDNEFKDNLDGGIIVLPESYNIDEYVFRSIIDRISTNFNITNWSIGNFLHGYYVGPNGKTFSEDSLSVELIGITDDILSSIAKQICGEMNQECVLIKSYNSNTVFFVEQ